MFVHRTYADKLSPKVVQSLLDLLCSQLKNLLSQAGVMLMASFGEGEGEEDDAESKKADSAGENEKRDFRGNCLASFLLQVWDSRKRNNSLNAEALAHSTVF